MRTILVVLPRVAISALALFVTPSVAAAQSFGIGGRLAWVTPDTEVDVDALRFTGGQIRLMSARYGLELSLDRHSEELENTKIVETPIQASLLLRLGGGSFSPFLLGGPGWYKRKVETIGGDETVVENTEFGWHAGGGLEIRAGRHFGIHGDYRYTFLDFSDDDEEEDDDGGFIRGLLPGHRGSMYTVGVTVYF